LKDFKNLWLNVYITTPFFTVIFAMEDAAKKVLYPPGSPAALSGCFRT